MFVRRARLSASQPSGHCRNNAPSSAAAMKLEMPAVPSPACCAKAGPVTQKALRAKPERKAPRVPSGDRMTSCRKARGACSGTKIGRAHVLTPVTNAHLVCRLLLEKKKKKQA